MKVCNKCGVELTLGENWLKSCAKNHDNICRNCKNKRLRKHYQNRKVEYKIKHAEYRKKHRKHILEQVKGYGHTLSGKYTTYKSSAKKRNHKFEFSLFDFATLILKPCYYCGKKDGIYNGIDRLDNNKGYVKGNCVSCCKSCNYAKRNYPLEEFKENTDRRFLHTLLKPFENIKEPLNIV